MAYRLRHPEATYNVRGQPTLCIVHPSLASAWDPMAANSLVSRRQPFIGGVPTIVLLEADDCQSSCRSSKRQSVGLGLRARVESCDSSVGPATGGGSAVLELLAVLVKCPSLGPPVPDSKGHCASSPHHEIKCLRCSCNIPDIQNSPRAAGRWSGLCGFASADHIGGMLWLRMPASPVRKQLFGLPRRYLPIGHAHTPWMSRRS